MPHDDAETWRQADAWEPFVYRAQVYDVTDGDTIKCRLDTGFYNYYHAPIRLATVDTREIFFTDSSSEEYRRGMIHKEFVEGWVSDVRDNGREWPFIVKTTATAQRGKYGRPLGRLFDRDGTVPPLDTALLETFDDVAHYDP